MHFLKKKGKRVLVISDLHCPFEIEGAVDFLNDVYKEFKCNEVICIGDEADMHALGDWDHDPDGLSPGDELRAAIRHLKPLFKAFPKVNCCISNHTARPFRRAFKAGIPKAILREYREILEAPEGWQWADRWEIDEVQYIHGEGLTGKYAHLTAAERHRQNTVIGHVHSYAAAQYSATNRDLIFGMNVGWLADIDKYAFRYGKNYISKPVNACGVVMDGLYPIVVPMSLGSKIQYIESSPKKPKNPYELNEPKVKYREMTKDDLKKILDSRDISYRVKETKQSLIAMIKTSETETEKQSKWKWFK